MNEETKQKDQEIRFEVVCEECKFVTKSYITASQLPGLVVLRAHIKTACDECKNSLPVIYTRFILD